MDSTIIMERVGAVAHLRLNRPEQLNAADLAMQRAFNRELAASSRDESVGAIVISGSGRCLSAGGDRTVLQRVLNEDPTEFHAELAAIADEQVQLMLGRVGQPIVIAVHGFAIGWGAGLVALSDYVVIEEDAYLQEPHALFGLHPTPACSLVWSSFLPPVVLKDILTTGRQVSAPEADRWGLANVVVPPGAATARALAVAATLAELPRAGVRAVKHDVHRDAGLLSMWTPPK